MTYLIILPLLLFFLKFVEYKWQKEGTAVPAPMRRVALAMLGIFAIMLIYSAEKKQSTVRTASANSYYTVRTASK